jgi:hypothetical protein
LILNTVKYISIPIIDGGLMKFFYRAMPVKSDYIRPGDYMTLSRRFAVEHAITTAIYNGEDYGIYVVSLEDDDWAEALNPGEYTYAGEAPVKARMIGIAKYDDFTSNAFFQRVAKKDLDSLKVFGFWNLEL